MVTQKDGELFIEIKMSGGGETLSRVQKALVLGIEEIGMQKERSGDQDHQEAVYVLSELLRGCMLDISQLNIGMGGRPVKN